MFLGSLYCPFAASWIFAMKEQQNLLNVIIELNKAVEDDVQKLTSPVPCPECGESTRLEWADHQFDASFDNCMVVICPSCGFCKSKKQIAKDAQHQNNTSEPEENERSGIWIDPIFK
jgi:hypothetical protein